MRVAMLVGCVLPAPALANIGFEHRSFHPGLHAAPSVEVSQLWYAAGNPFMHGSWATRLGKMAGPVKPLFVRLGGSVSDPAHEGWNGMTPDGADQPSARDGARTSTAPRVIRILRLPPSVEAPAQARRSERAVPSAAAASAPKTASQPLFGVPSIRISRTVHEAAWARVRQDRLPDALAGQCSGNAALCQSRLLREARRLLKEVSALPFDARVNRINRFVNRFVRFEDDISNFGVADYWASATETLQRGRGDCEDIAILKWSLLKAAGIPMHDMMLVLGRESKGGRDHAVLVVKRGDSSSIVLDNLTDSVLDADDPRHFLPMLAFSTGGSWIYGRRVASN